VDSGQGGLRLKYSLVNSSPSERHIGLRLKLAYFIDINRIHTISLHLLSERVKGLGHAHNNRLMRVSSVSSAPNHNHHSSSHLGKSFKANTTGSNSLHTSCVGLIKNQPYLTVL